MLTLRFIKQRYFNMTLLIILGLVFSVVAIMVILAEKFGKPMEAEEQVKFAKISRILIFILVAVAIFKGVSG